MEGDPIVTKELGFFWADVALLNGKTQTVKKRTIIKLKVHLLRLVLYDLAFNKFSLSNQYLLKNYNPELNILGTGFCC